MKPHFLFITAILAISSLIFLSFNLSTEGLASHSPLCSSNASILHSAEKNIAFGKEAALYLKNNFSHFDRKCNPNYRIKKVVIDPGHGGYDSGCSGKNSKEKHLALSIAKKMKVAIEQRYGDVQVIMTRETDVFVPLKERADLANDWNADLFISVHCNSIRDASYIKGTETYVLGTHKFEENLEIAKRENASILYEDNYQEIYNFDPNSDEGHITMSIYQSAFLEQSLLFASNIEERVAKSSGMKSRGVKQAGFLVLRETAMPSVLLETGYLTNAKDEQLLRSESGQYQIADIVLNAFSEYKNTLESTSGAVTYISSSSKSVKTKPEEVVTKSPAPQKKTVRPAPHDAPNIQYRIQLAASEKALDTAKGRWLNIQEYLVEIVTEGDLFKYQARGFYSYDQVKIAQKELQRRGFKSAWILAYKDGKKISVAEARKLLGR